MFDAKNITFTTTLKEIPAMRPLAEVLRRLGKGHKKPFVEQLVMKAALLAAEDQHAVTKIIRGKFKIVLDDDVKHRTLR